MTDYPGGDTIGIVNHVPTGQKDSMGVDITAESVVWVYGCVFEPYMYGINEQQSEVTTSQEKAYAYLPFVTGLGIPAVDTNGNPTTASIVNSTFLRPKRSDAQAQRDYKVFALPAEQYDLDGQADHVLVVCEWQGG